MSVMRFFGDATGPLERLEAGFRYRTPLPFNRLPAVWSDVRSADVVQVNPKDADALGRWALLSTIRLSAPVRIVSSDHVPLGAVRISYATRALWAIRTDQVSTDTTVWLQPLDSDPGFKPEVGAIGRLAERFMEFVLGPC